MENFLEKLEDFSMYWTPLNLIDLCKRLVRYPTNIINVFQLSGSIGNVLVNSIFFNLLL